MQSFEKRSGNTANSTAFSVFEALAELIDELLIHSLEALETLVFLTWDGYRIGHMKDKEFRYLRISSAIAERFRRGCDDC